MHCDIVSVLIIFVKLIIMVIGDYNHSTCGNDALAGLKVIMTLDPFSLYSMKFIVMVMTIRVLVVMMLWLD